MRAGSPAMWDLTDAPGVELDEARARVAGTAHQRPVWRLWAGV